MKASVPEPEPRSRTRSPGDELGEVEHVADAGVGVQRLRRDRVEPLDRVAEPLGQRAAQLEVELAVRVAGDGAVHLADVAADLVEVDG